MPKSAQIGGYMRGGARVIGQSFTSADDEVAVRAPCQGLEEAEMLE